MKNKSLFIAGIPVLLFTLFFGLAASLAQDKAPEVKKPEVSKPEFIRIKTSFLLLARLPVGQKWRSPRILHRKLILNLLTENPAWG